MSTHTASSLVPSPVSKTRGTAQIGKPVCDLWPEGPRVGRETTGQRYLMILCSNSTDSEWPRLWPQFSWVGRSLVCLRKWSRLFTFLAETTSYRKEGPPDCQDHAHPSVPQGNSQQSSGYSSHLSAQLFCSFIQSPVMTGAASGSLLSPAWWQQVTSARWVVNMFYRPSTVFCQLTGVCCSQGWVTKPGVRSASQQM